MPKSSSSAHFISSNPYLALWEKDRRTQGPQGSLKCQRQATQPALPGFFSWEAGRSGFPLKSRWSLGLWDGAMLGLRLSVNGGLELSNRYGPHSLWGLGLKGVR